MPQFLPIWSPILWVESSKQRRIYQIQLICDWLSFWNTILIREVRFYQLMDLAMVFNMGCVMLWKILITRWENLLLIEKLRLCCRASRIYFERLHKPADKLSIYAIYRFLLVVWESHGTLTTKNDKCQDYAEPWHKHV